MNVALPVELLIQYIAFFLEQKEDFGRHLISFHERTNYVLSPDDLRK